MRITASDVARWSGGRLIGLDATADGASFDTRTISPGQFFVAVRGERDGHDHVADAVAAGAAFVLVEPGRGHTAPTRVEVDDTVAALGAVATQVRATMSAPVVGITGSVGKTSTKNMVAAVLGAAIARVHTAAGSFNNDLGVPVTVLGVPEGCGALVLEMGMRGHGEIARLCRIAPPDVGVITVIGDAHSERVGGIEGVVRAKGEILEGIAPGGTAVLNADDPYEPALRRRVPEGVRTITFGSTMGADLRWQVTGRDDEGRAQMRIDHGDETAECAVPFPGDHMAANAAAALAVGLALGVSLADAARGLGDATAEPGRMRWTTTTTGARLLDDSYNANVQSMMAALDTLARAEADRRVAVLGAMAEVADPERAHATVAAHAAGLGIDIIAFETDLYGVAARGLTEVIEALAADASDAGAVVLVKGSRAAATERVVRALTSGV